MFKPKPKKISSLQNPLVKHLVKLRQDKRYRTLSNSVLISGYKLVKEISHIQAPKKLFIENLSDTTEAEEIYHVSPEVIKKIVGIPTPEPILAEFALPQPAQSLKDSPLLVLDSIRDPGNLGTLARTALALGWKGVYLLPTCADPFEDKVIRASRGAFFHLPWKKGDWEELIKIKNEYAFTAFIADMEGTPISSVKQGDQILLILSNEAKGPSLQAEQFGKKISIPMESCVESLNVSAAGAILMYYMIKK